MKPVLGWFLGVVALALLSSCSSVPPPQPAPAVKPAPAAVARLRIHVVNATSNRARDAKEDDVTGYTLHVRSAFQQLLQRAGHVVVVEPTAPRDLEVRITSDHEHRTQGSFGSLVVAVTLLAPGGEVDQISGIVPILEHADIELEAVARLVEAFGQSPRVHRYAERVQRPDVPCAPSGPQIAAP